MYNLVEIMKFLIENRVSINDMDNYDNTTLTIDSKIGNIEVVK